MRFMDGEVKSFICKTQWNIAAMSIALTSEARIYHDHNYDSSTQMILFCPPPYTECWGSFPIFLACCCASKKNCFERMRRNSFIKNLSTHNRIYLDQMQRRMRVARGNEEFFILTSSSSLKQKKNLFLRFFLKRMEIVFLPFKIGSSPSLFVERKKIF